MTPASGIPWTLGELVQVAEDLVAHQGQQSTRERLDALSEKLNPNRSRDSVQLMSDDMAKALGFYEDPKWGNPSAAGTAVAKLVLDHDPRLKKNSAQSHTLSSAETDSATLHPTST